MIEIPKKFCPLRSNGVMFDEGGGTQVECSMKCAWYFWKYNCCAILSIAEDIDNNFGSKS